MPDSARDSPEVSVVLPALNEEETIGECIGKIRRVFRDNGIDGEIVVSDSSSDRTTEIAAAMGARIVRMDRRGYGNAYLEAFRAVRGRFVVIGDADNTYDFLEIPRLLEPLRNGYDLVLGSRFSGEIKAGAMRPLHRYVGNPLFVWLVNAMFGTQFTDVHTGFRAIRKDALDRLPLKTGGMEFASEMLIEAARAGIRITEVPIAYYPRRTPSKLRSFTDGWRHLRFLLLYRPLPFLAGPGAVFALAGLLLMLRFYLGGEAESHHLHSFILGVIALVGGLQALLMGINIKVYSIVHGYGDRSRLASRFMDYYSLEWLLVLSAALMLAGIAIGMLIVQHWVALGFGPLDEVANAIIALVLILSGVQVLFFAVLQSMMLLNDRENP
ncbi:MAG: glycosyltransferase [Methanomicrobiales archaeon]|nr:glycosyltransferase [Methanomicrobiales archaeon]